MLTLFRPFSIRTPQEVKLGDRERIRQLFERACHLEMPPKKMKFLFKRYMQARERPFAHSAHIPL